MPQQRIFDSLIDADQLASLLDAGTAVLFDTRYSLTDEGAGQRLYAESHIPGAIFIDLKHDLSGTISSTTGRHPLPDPARLAQHLRECGVNRDTQIVAYDDASGAFAARLWWLYKWLGHDRAAVLNGGFAGWKASGRPVSTAIPVTSTKGDFKENIRPELLVTAGNLAEHLKNHAAISLIDARGPERFRGDMEPLDKVAGHIPGAVNLPFPGNLDENGFFLTPEKLKERHETSGPAIHMCGSGVTACHNILASFAAGLDMPRLYAGSWSEWITDPARPITKGA